MIADLLVEVDGLANTLRRGRSVNVNDRGTKDRVVALARRYFEQDRPGVVTRIEDHPDVASADSILQDMVRLAQGNNARTTYVRKVRELRAHLKNVNVDLVASPSLTSPSSSQNTSEEQLVVDTITALVPSAAASYQQGLRDLRDNNRVSYRGPAVEFREAVREVLDHLAPDDAVMSQPGFKLERGRSGPTMKQKVRFVLKSRGRNKSQRDSSEKSIGLVDDRIGEVTRAVYDRASVATHVVETREEVAQIKRYVDTVLFDILEIRS